MVKLVCNQDLGRIIYYKLINSYEIASRVGEGPKITMLGNKIDVDLKQREFMPGPG
jgi:hypothetical protein